MAWTFFLKSTFLITVLFLFFYLILFFEKLQLYFVQKTFVSGGRRGLPRFTFFPNIFKALSKNTHSQAKLDQDLSLVLSLMSLLFSIFPYFVIPFFSKGAMNGFIISEIFHSPLPILVFLLSFLLGLFPQLIEAWLCGEVSSYLSTFRQFLWRLTSFLVLFLLVLSCILIYKTPEIHSIIAQQEQPFLGSLPSWGIFTQPLGAMIFIALIALYFSGKGYYGLSTTKESDLLLGKYKHNDALSFYIFKLSDHFCYMGLIFLFVFLYLGGYSPLFYFEQNISSSLGLPLFQTFSLFIKVGITHCIIFWGLLSVPNLKWNLFVKLPLTVFFPLSICNLIMTLLWIYTYKDVSL